MGQRPAIEFGYFLVPDASDIRGTIRLGRLADELGLDLLGVQDHPYQSRFVDTWTLLSVIAAQTERIRVFPDVASLPLRPPAVLAKAAASLDLITAGRVELGLGAGAFWPAIAAMDGPARTPGASVAALEEAIQVIRLMWSGERGVRFKGSFYNLSGLHAGPQPSHRIGIWLGAYRPRMLELTGRLADGWIPSLGYIKPEALDKANARIDGAARLAGRRPEEIRRLLNVGGTFSDASIQQLVALAVDHRVDAFIAGAETDEELRRFALEVAPAVREEVARRHG